MHPSQDHAEGLHQERESAHEEHRWPAQPQSSDNRRELSDGTVALRPTSGEQARNQAVGKHTDRAADKDQGEQSVKRSTDASVHDAGPIGESSDTEDNDRGQP